MRVLAGGSAILIAGVSWAGAATDTGRLGVSASIVDHCAVGNAVLAPGASAMINADGTLATAPASAIGIPWDCTSGTSASLAFSHGSNFRGAQGAAARPSGYPDTIHLTITFAP